MRTAKGLSRRPARASAGPSVRLLVFAFVAASGAVTAPALPVWSGETPVDLRGRSGDEGYRILELDRERGFRRIESLTYIVDPDLRDPESWCYRRPQDTGAGELRGIDACAELTPLLVPGRGGEIRAAVLFEEVMGDFFRLVSKRAVRPTGLLELLKEHGARSSELTRHLVTVGACFRARLPSETSDGASEPALECRLRVRLFKMRIAPIESRDPALEALSNLGYSELLFEDTATGRAPLEEFEGRPEDAVRAALIDALRGRLAVNFCMNPRLNHRALSQALTSDVCGVSISEYRSRGD